MTGTDGTRMDRRSVRKPALVVQLQPVIPEAPHPTVGFALPAVHLVMGLAAQGPDREIQAKGRARREGEKSHASASGPADSCLRILRVPATILQKAWNEGSDPAGQIRADIACHKKLTHL